MPNKQSNTGHVTPTQSIKPIAIVTGAGGDLGCAIALSLSAVSWRVVVNDIDATQAQNTANEIQQSGGTCMTVVADIGNEIEVDNLFSEIKEHWNQSPTLLINNAGIQTWASLKTLKLEDWQKTINTNLTAGFLMTKSFANSEPVNDASIINIGSGCNRLPFPGLVDYTASKGGIEMLTKSAALELGPSGIRVNCIAPGAIATSRTAKETDDYDKRWSELTPLRRIGTPQDVANAVLLLADKKASFITGQTINVDGGLFSQSVWPKVY